MSYLKVTREIYDMLQKTDFKKLLGYRQNSYSEVKAFMENRFKVNEIISAYHKEMNSTLDKYLPMYKEDLRNFLKSEEVSYYEKHMPLKTAFHLFWIWEKQLEIEEADLYKFMESFYLGTFGYKMLDVQGDSKNLYTEMIFVGLHAIKLAEQLLSEVLGVGNTSKVIMHYFKIYTDIEYFEKKSRWKDSPFSWAEAKKLGDKAAPIHLVFESLFRFANYEEQRINDLMQALNYSAAALQMIDDLVDAKEDLSNGYETLVMSGYYKKFGFEEAVNKEKISAILDQNRLKKIYSSVEQLLNKSRVLLEKHDEYIILLVMELQYFNINSLFSIK